MLINHPTDGATRGLTLRFRLLGQFKKQDNIYKNCFVFWQFSSFFFPQKICYADCSLIRSNTVVAFDHDSISFIAMS